MSFMKYRDSYSSYGRGILISMIMGLLVSYFSFVQYIDTISFGAIFLILGPSIIGSITKDVKKSMVGTYIFLVFSTISSFPGNLGVILIVYPFAALFLGGISGAVFEEYEKKQPQYLVPFPTFQKIDFSCTIGILASTVAGLLWHRLYNLKLGFIVEFFLMPLIAFLAVPLITKLLTRDPSKTTIYHFFFLFAFIYPNSIYWEEFRNQTLLETIFWDVGLSLLICGLALYFYFWSVDRNPTKSALVRRTDVKIIVIALLSTFFVVEAGMRGIILAGRGEMLKNMLDFLNLLFSSVWSFLSQNKLQIACMIYIIDVSYNINAYLNARREGLDFPRMKVVLLILGSFPLFVDLLRSRR